MIEKALYELIKAIPDVPDAIYAMRAPQNAPAPFIIYQRTDSERDRVINGPTGLNKATIQVDVYAGEYFQTKELARKIEIALDGYRGLVQYGANSPRDEYKIAGITLERESDIPDSTDEPFLFRNAASYVITYHQG